MALYEITETGLRSRAPSGFADLNILERQDLQRLLRDRIEVLDPDLLVVAEEFGDWEDARRRIDLLAIDRSGHLVVIELKRTDDGGFMELQALRYAAMVSAMGFEQVEEAFARFLADRGDRDERTPRAQLVEWLGADEESEEPPPVSSEVRILLVSAGFGRELTTTVLWLNDLYGLDIRCMGLTPYELDGRVLLDIRQVIPLPEAQEYQVRLRRKEQEQERARRSGRDFTRYHVIVRGVELPDTNKRRSVLGMIRALVESGVSADRVFALLPSRQVCVLEGEIEAPTQVVAAMEGQGRRQVGRFFTDEPFPARGETFVLSKMWGAGTEGMLRALAEAFPEADVTFREADD